MKQVRNGASDIAMKHCLLAAKNVKHFGSIVMSAKSYLPTIEHHELNRVRYVEVMRYCRAKYEVSMRPANRITV